MRRLGTATIFGAALAAAAAAAAAAYYFWLRPLEGRAPPCDSYGDLDGDGYIRPGVDSELLGVWLGGGWEAVQEKAAELGIELKIDEAEFLRRADTEGDGTVSVRDAQIIEKYARGMLDTFPVCLQRCEEGETTCIGDDLYVCWGGQWVLLKENAEECGYQQQPPAECEEGETQCVGYDLYECRNGQWALVERNSEECGYVPPPPPTAPGIRYAEFKGWSGLWGTVEVGCRNLTPGEYYTVKFRRWTGGIIDSWAFKAASPDYVYVRSVPFGYYGYGDEAREVTIILEQGIYDSVTITIPPLR